MTVITHLAVGAALGTLTGNRGLAFVFGLASHIPLDVLPHYEFEKMWVEVAVVVAALAAMVAAGLASTGILWGALGGILPDLENLLWRLGILPDDRKVFPGHTPRLSRILPHGRQLGPRHAVTQAVIICAAAVAVVLSVRGVY